MYYIYGRMPGIHFKLDSGHNGINEIIVKSDSALL